MCIPSKGAVPICCFRQFCFLRFLISNFRFFYSVKVAEWLKMLTFCNAYSFDSWKLKKFGFLFPTIFCPEFEIHFRYTTVLRLRTRSRTMICIFVVLLVCSSTPCMIHQLSVSNLCEKKTMFTDDSTWKLIAYQKDGF